MTKIKLGGWFTIKWKEQKKPQSKTPASKKFQQKRLRKISGFRDKISKTEFSINWKYASNENYKLKETELFLSTKQIESLKVIHPIEPPTNNGKSIKNRNRSLQSKQEKSSFYNPKE